MKQQHPKGQLLIIVLVGMGLMFFVLGGIVNWSFLNLRLSRQTSDRERAFQIAEAGIEYYRWHLAHAPQDFQDGTGAPGPYVHNYTDKDGNAVGTFSLTVTPPSIGSTIVTVVSTGKVTSNPNVHRTIKVKLAIPSLAKYSVVANEDMRFGEGTEVFGPIHSNGGIRFDGFAHNLITSSQTSYDDPDGDDCNDDISFGVHTCDSPADPEPPAALPSRPDIFAAGRQFPVPVVDFAGLTADLSQMRTDAQANGFYRAASGGVAYQVVLRTDDTFRLYRVTSFTNPPSNCTNALDQDGWGTWSVRNRNLLGTYSFPANGLIFLEDHVIVEGQVNGARLTIAAASFPDNPPTRKNIIVNEDLLYTAYDGTDVIALIAQNNVNIGLVSADDLRIDAALVAQNGRVGRHYYRGPDGSRCSPYHERDTITAYGMIATNQRYGFAYTDNTGYETRNLIYDANLLYGPPPSFPLTSDQYTILSWEETP